MSCQIMDTATFLFKTNENNVLYNSVIFNAMAFQSID